MHLLQDRAAEREFDALRIERTASGAVRIEAPPEAAEQLVALFQGMAKLLGASAAARP
ncbi:MAG: hypothetical protein HS104_33445 [Polyangiaceae bacterium]|nr:hypothetical protein [Polyangiaceae bacterium]MCL4753286.1 hypothetical protein [Myxococcales bacterium]